MKSFHIAVVAMCAAMTSAAEKHWLGTDAANPTLASVAENWSPAGAPTAADDVVLDAGSNNNPMTWDLDNGVASWTQSDYTGTVTFKTGKSVSFSGNTYTAYGVTQTDGSKSFTISGNLTLSSGTWTHAATPAMTSSATNLVFYKTGTGIYRLLVSVGGNCMIGSGVAIDVSAKGFTGANSFYGPGYANSMASHGGMGSYQSVGGSNRACCYGMVARPQTIGSARSSVGGGNVQLEVVGALTLNGNVLAKSGDNAANYSGSGGGIFIHARTISGSGTVSASSGTVTSIDPGGGGRVAIWVDEGDFSNFPVDNVTANAGNGHALSTAGTVFLWAKSDATFGARLIVRGNASVTTTQANYRYTCTPISAANTNELPALTAIVLSNGANLAVGADVELDVGKILATASGTTSPRFTMFGGRLCVPDGFMVDGFGFRVFGEGASLAVANNGVMGVASGYSMTIDRRFLLDGSLVTTGTVSHTAVSSASTNILDLVVSGDMTVAGLIDVSNKGWDAKAGPGGATEVGMGGAHAGTVPGSTQHAYGSITCPTNHGSGGGVMSGGGVVKLEVGGTFTLNGTIRAYSSNNNGGGNGSGGSVWITAGELDGNGSIDAKGGSYGAAASVAPCEGAGGSGGRISVWQTVGNKTRSEWHVETTLTGGTSSGGYRSGGGTFYWQKAQDGIGGGTVSTGFGSATAAPEIPTSDMSEKELACATVSVGSGNFLCVAADVTVGDFRLPAASTVRLNGHALTVKHPAQSQAKSVLGTVDAGDGGEIIWTRRGTMVVFQ